MTLPKSTFERVVALLTPHMTTSSARQSLLLSALIGCPVLNQIDWEGPVQSFTVLLVRNLETFGNCTPGKSALVQLLETLKEYVGTNKQVEIDSLIDELMSNRLQQGAAPMIPIPPEAIPTAWSFLISVGTLAATELKERWSLKRKQKSETDKHASSIPLVDASSQNEANAGDGATALQDLLTGRTASDISRVLSIVEQKRDLIYGWQEDRIAHLNEQRQKTVPDAAINARIKKLDKQISDMLREIERDLKSIGLEVEKQPIE